jgi:hypothetical protein
MRRCFLSFQADFEDSSACATRTMSNQLKPVRIIFPATDAHGKDLPRLGYVGMDIVRRRKIIWSCDHIDQRRKGNIIEARLDDIFMPVVEPGDDVKIRAWCGLREKLQAVITFETDEIPHPLPTLNERRRLLRELKKRMVEEENEETPWWAIREQDDAHAAEEPHPGGGGQGSDEEGRRRLARAEVRPKDRKDDGDVKMTKNKHVEKKYDLESVECSPGSEMTMSIQPTGYFKCENIVMEPSVEGFFLLDVMVGRVPQISDFRNPGQKITPTPVEVFAPPEPDRGPTKFYFDVCMPQLEFKVVVRNQGKTPGKIKLTLAGKQMKAEDVD